jgi:glutamyl-tRNA reductase
MTIVCVGLSHREAPIAVREQLAVPEAMLQERLRELRALPGVREAMLLSTCNRLEIFAAAEGRGSCSASRRAWTPWSWARRRSSGR